MMYYLCACVYWDEIELLFVVAAVYLRRTTHITFFSFIYKKHKIRLERVDAPNGVLQIQLYAILGNWIHNETMDSRHLVGRNTL